MSSPEDFLFLQSKWNFCGKFRDVPVICLWKVEFLQAGEYGGRPQRVTQEFGKFRLLAFGIRPLRFRQQLNLALARQIDCLAEHAGCFLGRMKSHGIF